MCLDVGWHPPPKKKKLRPLGLLTNLNIRMRGSKRVTLHHSSGGFVNDRTLQPRQLSAASLRKRQSADWLSRLTDGERESGNYCRLEIHSPEGVPMRWIDMLHCTASPEDMNSPLLTHSILCAALYAHALCLLYTMSYFFQLAAAYLITMN